MTSSSRLVPFRHLVTCFAVLVAFVSPISARATSVHTETIEFDFGASGFGNFTRDVPLSRAISLKDVSFVVVEPLWLHQIVTGGWSLQSVTVQLIDEDDDLTSIKTGFVVTVEGGRPSPVTFYLDSMRFIP